MSDFIWTEKERKHELTHPDYENKLALIANSYNLELMWMVFSGNVQNKPFFADKTGFSTLDKAKTYAENECKYLLKEQTK